MKLVIVESPNKCKKIREYLGAGYEVVATVGHFRDLPERELGVDVATMTPTYIIKKGKEDVAKRLCARAKLASEIIIATDADREGDAEWAAHDSQGIKLREYESLENIMSISRACEDWDCEKVQAFIDLGITSDLEQLSESMAEHDGGEFSSGDDWARDYIESAYDLDKMLGNLASYFDYEAFARDAELGGDVTFVTLPSGGVWVVNNN